MNVQTYAIIPTLCRRLICLIYLPIFRYNYRSYSIYFSHINEEEATGQAFERAALLFRQVNAVP